MLFKEKSQEDIKAVLAERKLADTYLRPLAKKLVIDLTRVNRPPPFPLRVPLPSPVLAFGWLTNHNPEP